MRTFVEGSSTGLAFSRLTPGVNAIGQDVERVCERRFL